MQLKHLFFYFSLLLIPTINFAQDSPTVKRSASVKSIRDIPHKTLWEKWMWIHRSAAFIITKERPVNYDKAYITSFYKRLVITVPISTRFLTFSLKDFDSGNKLTFAPNIQYDLGISVSSRWASFIINTGVKVYSSDTNTRGRTKYQDYQLNLYGRKFTTDMFVQYYSGFYIRNSRAFEDFKGVRPYEVRSDVKAFNMGVSSYYIFNNRRFSYGNSFSFVEQQKKSAGSPLIGLYYTYFDASGSPSLVNAPFRNSFDTLSIVRKGHTHNFGVNVGYIYTLVFLKKCYATASLVQGIGGKQVVYEREDNSKFQQLTGGAGKLNLRLALRYDNGRYFIGTMGMFDYFLSVGKSDATFDYSFGKFMVYAGYRFSVLKTERKLLRKLKLIEY